MYANDLTKITGGSTNWSRFFFRWGQALAAKIIPIFIKSSFIVLYCLCDFSTFMFRIFNYVYNSKKYFQDMLVYNNRVIDI